MHKHIPRFKMLTETLLMVSLTLCSTSRAGAEPPVGVGELDAVKQRSGMSIADLFQKTSPAVVKILVNGESHKGVATGSGFVVSWPTPDSCEVVTNYHVIRPGVTATVEFDDGQVADVGRVLTENRTADLALVEVKLPKDYKLLTHAEIDIKSTSKPPIGTRVIAIGSPKGMTNTLSDGLISGYRTQSIKENWIQITNPIGPGSSGGPLFDEDGRFVGVTTASFEDAQNLNFAVPASAVRALLEEKRTPRDFWKGSSVDAEEEAVYRAVFDEVFSKFCASSEELKDEHEGADLYFIVVNGQSVFNERDQRFRNYCEELARMDDPFGLIVRGYYTAQEGHFKSWETYQERITDGIQSLKRALQKAERYRFFVLYAIGDAEWTLAERTHRATNVQKILDPKDFAPALEYLEKARNANPDFAPTLHVLAMVLTECRQYSAALSVSKELLERVPGSAKAHLQRAELLVSMGSTLDALVEYQIAANLDPYEFLAPIRLGKLYSQTGQHEKAIQSYKAAVDVVHSMAALRFGPGPDARADAWDRQTEAVYLVWQIRRFIGWEYIRLNRFDEALAMFEQALKTPGVDDDPGVRPMLQQDIATCLEMRAGKR